VLLATDSEGITVFQVVEYEGNINILLQRCWWFEVKLIKEEK
jgi:hypothetical protein